MPKAKLTIAICVRNGAATIERAVRSVVNEPNCELILADDHCTDNTVELALAIAPQLRVVRVPDPGNVSMARQAALEVMQTEYGTWLDADDEWVPGRAARFIEVLENYDIASESIDLIDGSTGKFLRTMSTPEFLHREITPARLFERNYLACDTQVGFRVDLFRKAGGYDSALNRSESMDILLRALMLGARFHYGKEPGYKMYAYQGSLSRQIDLQRAALAVALKKHNYEDVRALCLRVGESPRQAGWVLVSLALYRYEPAAALTFIEQASPATAPADEVLEPDGPFPFHEGWRRAFGRGTILLLIGGRDAEASQELQKAEAIEPTAEGANNLGVALARLGNLEAARECFKQSESRFPGYLDAKLNGQDEKPARITTHPLRRQASRSEYSTSARVKSS